MKENVTGFKYKRYTAAFRLLVVRDMEENHLSMYKVREKYDICDQTIKKWLIKYGKQHLLPIKVLVMQVEEQDLLKASQTRVKEMESLVVSMQMERHRQQMFYEEALRQIGMDKETFEKKTGFKR
jgi:transposase